MLIYVSIFIYQCTYVQKKKNNIIQILNKKSKWKTLSQTGHIVFLIFQFEI